MQTRRRSIKHHVPRLFIVGLLGSGAAVSVHHPLAAGRPAAARSRGARVGMSSRGHDFSRHNPAFDRFLLQRAVQTHICYLNELHDQPNARFIAGFLEHQGIDRYHGFDGLRVEPEDYIEQLLASPPTTVQVRASVGRVSWGGSPGNPHLSRREVACRDFVVYPDRIGAALLRVRDHIAEEMAADLDVLAAADMSFWARRSSGVQMAPADGSSTAESSPTRRATYDLLQKLTLHVAVRQTLFEFSREPRGEAAARHGWLERKFAESGFLCGDQGFGASAHFLDAMAQEGAVLVRSADQDDARCAIVEPHAIANQVRAGARPDPRGRARRARRARPLTRLSLPVPHAAPLARPPSPQILDARVLLSRHFKGRLDDVHERGTDQLRKRLERSLRAQFRE